MIKLTSNQKAEILKKNITEAGQGREFRFFDVKHGNEKFQVSWNKQKNSFNCTCKYASYYGVKKTVFCCHIKAIMLYMMEKFAKRDHLKIHSIQKEVKENEKHNENCRTGENKNNV